MILFCAGCRDSYSPSAQWQDGEYGKGNRVHNETAEFAGTERIYRCTICGATRTKRDKGKGASTNTQPQKAKKAKG